VLSRDGSKTLASDTPDVPDVRRMSTRELRAERDRLAELRAECPPDRSRELRLATQRAGEAEQARQQARKDQQQAAEEVAALQGRLLRRRDLQAARDRLTLANHALQTTTGQADQAAERLGILRRAQQRRLGWLEAHDEDLRLQERVVAREAAWRRRVDQRALVLDPPGWLLAELGPVPGDPQERAVWRTAAAELDGYRRAYGLHYPPPAKHAGAGWPGTDGRRRRLRPPPSRGPPGSAGSGSAAAVTSALIAGATSGGGRPWPTVGAGPTRSGCWAPNPAATPPAAGVTGRSPGPRWSAWPAGTATATTGIRTANDSAAPLAATSAAGNATAASWQKGAAPHAPAPRSRPGRL
jgi:hypothetical protein